MDNSSTLNSKDLNFRDLCLLSLSNVILKFQKTPMATFRKAVINQRILLKIKESVWIRDEDKGFEIGLNSVDNPYQIFEGVFVNVSASIGRQWRDVYNAKTHQTELYVQLSVCAILIDKWLKKRFKMYPEDRVHLLGARLSEIVMKYKNSLD